MLGQDATRILEPGFRIEMMDATIVVGRPRLEKIELDLGFDQVAIPIEKVRAVRLIAPVGHAGQQATLKSRQRQFVIELRNTDRFSGQILNPPFVVEFSGGTVTLPFEEIKTIQANFVNDAEPPMGARGPIFRFDFEGNSRTIARNKISANHVLQLNGAKRVQKSKVRKGMILDGSTVMTIPHSQELCPQQFSLSAWIKPTGDRDEYAFILGKSTSSTWLGGFAFVYLNDDPDHIHFYVNGYQNQIVRTVAKKDQWIHLVGTCDGKEVILYVNGKPAQRTNYPQGQPVMHTQGPLSIGGDPTNYRWSGEIDEVEMYNHALSPEQVRVVYNRHILP